MEKTRHTIRLSQDTARRLKVRAAEAGLTQGELLATLLKLKDRGEISDEKFSEAMARNYFESHKADYEALLEKWGNR
ncbi:MAG: hypothetical protein GXY42_07005 [Desulfovibrionales bacterium]|nr:hypothetical protein [Desulfovibrionales bacterium]